MNNEIKEILDMFTKYKDDWYSVEYILKPKQCVALYDYITNLRDTLQDREEYIGHLEELCNKYEKEHSTTFNEWKETITDKYQTLKNLQEEKEKYKNVIDKIKEYAKEVLTWYTNEEITDEIAEHILELLEEVE